MPGNMHAHTQALENLVFKVIQEFKMNYQFNQSTSGMLTLAVYRYKLLDKPANSYIGAAALTPQILCTVRHELACRMSETGESIKA